MSTKYQKWYDSIIKNRINNIPDGYTETHHIIPKCIGGTDEKTNLVKLTAREHYICHLLLTKIFPNKHGIKLAFVMMLVENPNQKRNYIITSKMYEYAKKCNSEVASERMKGVSYNKGRRKYYNKITLEERFFENTPSEEWIHGSLKNRKTKNKGKKYFYNPETMQVKSFATIYDAPAGWIRGNPNADVSNKNNLKGTTYFYNPVTGDEGRFSKCPEGWIKGRVVGWINDGNICKQHNKTHTLPDGFVWGRLMNWKRNQNKK